MTKGRTCRVAVIGMGAIGDVVVRELLAMDGGCRLVGVAVRSGREGAVRERLADVPCVAGVGDLVALAPDLVVECAGQEALAAYAPRLLDAGIDLMAVSTGHLARPGVLEDWTARAKGSGARLIIPAGAIAGLDGLGALKRAGLTRVVYTSIKPPHAWRGTPAEGIVDLDAVTEATTFFEGPAREAALAYPKNANLAATVALAGPGLDETLVRLVADPRAKGNTGVVEAESAGGVMRVEMAGKASVNPKTSAVTAFSLVHALATRTACLVI